MRFLEELAARRRFGMKPGLETIRSLCAALDDPQLKFKAVHVAGTNGKGAVCAILDAALRAASGMRDEGRGMRIGRYTSPHLVKLNERFFLDGAPIDDQTLERVAERVNSNIQTFKHSDVTFFEALTAIAFLLYAEAKVDCAILECGLGGRLDATNVCRPELTVITRVGLDHCDWLGETVEKIAAEKAGILKPDVPVVLGANEPGVRTVVEARARDVGAPFFYAPELAAESEVPDDFSLGGPFNRENAVTALAALRVLERTGRLGGWTVDSLLSGFSRVEWPGRFQRVGNVLVDGAHNPPAARALAAALTAAPGPYDLIAGFCGDKDIGEVLRLLAPFAARGLAVRTVNPRSLPAAETARRMRAAGLAAEPYPSLRAAFGDARASGRPTLVCGSLFLAGEALVELGVLGDGGRFDPSEKLV